MEIKKEQNKFIVFKNSKISELMELSPEFARRFVDCIRRYNEYVIPEHKYIVCNQNEPYAEDVWDVILQGETRKHLYELDRKSVV